MSRQYPFENFGSEIWKFLALDSWLSNRTTRSPTGQYQAGVLILVALNRCIKQAGRFFKLVAAARIAERHNLSAIQRL